MKQLLTDIFQVVKDTHQELKEIKEILDSKSAKQDKPLKLIYKGDVMRILGISGSTYRHYVKAGRLKPMFIHGIDMYREEDLRKELD